MRFIYT